MSRLRPSPLVLLALALAALAWLDALGPDFLLPLDNRVTDAYLRAHAARQAADPAIVIVDIDERSLALMAPEAGSWPWPRAVHGELVAALQRQRPRAIVFDIEFADRDRFRADSDAWFNEVLAGFDNVYFPMVRLDPAGDPLGLPLAEFAPRLGILPGPAADPSARVALSVAGALDPAHWRLGAINFREDPADGIGRRYPLELDAHGWRIPSLPARVARDLGFTVPAQPDIVLGWRGGALAHPHVSYADLYADAGRGTPTRPADEFRDRIVVIGATAPGLHDIRATPISGRHQGVEILATALDNLKNDGWLRPAPAWLPPLIASALLAALVAAFTRSGQHALRIGLGLVAASGALLAAGHFAVGQRWLLPPLAPLFFAWVFYFAAALREYLRERRAREHTVAVFNRFLDPRVVRALVERGVSTQTLEGGKTQAITVLFSDVRNFTTYSEAHDAGEVVELLNRYFSMQVEVIFRHGGTLDKFIGDAIMAFWGAPADDPEHAAHAVAAALEMAERLESFRQALGPEGAAFDVGIGIHSGPAVVGFIGSERRQDYTAIGDTVNLASRIEGLTKGVARILVSGETRAACGDRFAFVDHGPHQVKGRHQEVQLFEPRRHAP